MLPISAKSGSPSWWRTKTCFLCLRALQGAWNEESAGNFSPGFISALCFKVQRLFADGQGLLFNKLLKKCLFHTYTLHNTVSSVLKDLRGVYHKKYDELDPLISHHKGCKVMGWTASVNVSQSPCFKWHETFDYDPHDMRKKWHGMATMRQERLIWGVERKLETVDVDVVVPVVVIVETGEGFQLKGRKPKLPHGTKVQWSVAN